MRLPPTRAGTCTMSARATEQGSVQVHFIVATGRQQNVWQVGFRVFPPILPYKLNTEKYAQTSLKRRSCVQIPASWDNTHHGSGVGQRIAILLVHVSWKETWSRCSKPFLLSTAATQHCAYQFAFGIKTSNEKLIPQQAWISWDNPPVRKESWVFTLV